MADLLNLKKFLSGNLQDDFDSQEDSYIVQPASEPIGFTTFDNFDAPKPKKLKQQEILSSDDDDDFVIGTSVPDLNAELAALDAVLAATNGKGKRKSTRGAARKNIAKAAPKPRRSRATKSKKTVPQVEPEATTPVPQTSRRGRKRQREPETVDLIKSPPLVLPGVVSLDSDDECRLALSTAAELSFDDLNYEMSIKVSWNGEIERIPMKKYQKFGQLMNNFAARTNADPANVILMLDEKILRAEDTPDSVNYGICDIITGRVVEGISSMKQRKNRDKNEIKVKIQAAGLKKPLDIQIDKTKEFTAILYKCADALKVDAGKLKIYFDGDLVELTDTPLDLEFEGGEILDINFIST